MIWRHFNTLILVRADVVNKQVIKCLVNIHRSTTDVLLTMLWRSDVCPDYVSGYVTKCDAKCVPERVAKCVTKCGAKCDAKCVPERVAKCVTECDTKCVAECVAECVTFIC